MEPASIMAAVTALLSITDKLLDKMPDYRERKRKEFHSLKLELQKMENMDYDDENFSCRELNELSHRVCSFLEDYHRELFE